MKKICIYNANIILSDEVIKGYILINNGIIEKVSSNLYLPPYESNNLILIDAENSYVMPGIIDLHSDAIEKEIQPRPKTLLPIEMAFYELEKKLAASGITTIYHSLCLSDDWGVRDSENVINIINKINTMKKYRAMIEHKIHIRYEITYLEGLSKLENLIKSKSVDFLSYMDHSPGQGQFKNIFELKQYSMSSHGRLEKEVEDIIERSLTNKKKVDWSKLKSIALLARANDIRLAFHDDDSIEKIEKLIEFEGVLSEFPVNLETATYAKEQGLHVCVGAPNIIRGKSHNNNMRAIEAIKSGAADIICSDYVPSSIIVSIFKLIKKGIPLYHAVNMATLNPATALGINSYIGSIKEGNRADLILVDLINSYPIVRKTIFNGKPVYQSDYTVFCNMESDNYANT